MPELHRASTTVGALIAVVLCWAGAAGADEGSSPAEHPPTTAKSSTRVVLADVLICDLKTSAGGMTAAERAAVINGRIVTALSAKVTSEDAVAIRDLNGEKTLHLNDQLILTVTCQDADANHRSPAVLAAVWADNLRGAARRMARNNRKAVPD
ncbi:MAG: hypothetical protein HYU66_24660 [Armatimonadetes bacterium]|nr:hypothetical protein [Armatimonadota bacterium]